MAGLNDRIFTRLWEVDTGSLAPLRTCNPIPSTTDRQELMFFDGRRETMERFAIRQRIPRVQDDPCQPPSQLQYDAVVRFYGDACETQLEASLLLSARNYADRFAGELGYTAVRRQLLAKACAAFILADIETRLKVRAVVRRSISDVRPKDAPAVWKALHNFSGRAIADARRDGSILFD